MHPEQIKADIRMAGTTPAVIAHDLGITRGTVSMVIHGRGVSLRVQTYISNIIGKPVDEIWPPRKQLPKVQRKQAAD